MKHITIALLMLTCSAFGQDWNIARCRRTFEDRHKQLTEHLGSLKRDRVERFRSSVGWTPTQTLIGWQQELETCTKSDGERALYRSVSRQLNEVLDVRFSAYVLEEREGLLAFSEWEGEKRREKRSIRSMQTLPRN